jgi:hypothetical protein
MNYDEFKRSMERDYPLSSLPETLTALWYDGKGDWERSHEIAQDIHSKEGAWVHAYLHRKEGDLGNAAYWYNKAERAVSKSSLENEWDEIVRELLEAYSLKFEV